MHRPGIVNENRYVHPYSSIVHLHTKLLLYLSRNHHQTVDDMASSHEAPSPKLGEFGVAEQRAIRWSVFFM
jgi:hypothetical protein